jgi:hypothetical protein
MISAPLVRLPCSTTVRNNRISVKSKRNSLLFHRFCRSHSSEKTNCGIWPVSLPYDMRHHIRRVFYGCTRHYKGCALMRVRFAHRAIHAICARVPSVRSKSLRCNTPQSE